MIVFTKKNKKNSKKLLTVYIVFGIVPIVATISKTYNRNAICGSVGTGRRARLGSCEHCARVGSSPIFRIRNGLNAIICAFKPFFCVIIIT